MMILPGDLCIDILSRLPIESLLHCRCVCRAWRRLVEDPTFANLQLARSKQKLTFQLNRTSLCFLDFDHEIQNRNEPFKALVINRPPELLPHHSTPFSSCHGLLCFSRPPCFHTTLLVTNPVTGEYLSLSPSIHEYANQLGRSVCYGIGFDSVGKQYKVVRIFSTPYEQHGHVELCTLGCSLTWRYVGKISCFFRNYMTAGIFIDGALYWSMERDNVRSILSMDMASEKFRSIELPEMRGPLHAIRKWKGCLGVLDASKDPGCCRSIWVLKNYPPKEGKSSYYWFKDTCTECESLSKYHPVGVGTNGEIWIYYKKIIWRLYDITSGSFDYIQFQVPPLGRFYSCYRPSFVRIPWGRSIVTELKEKPREDFQSEAIHIPPLGHFQSEVIHAPGAVILKVSFRRADLS